MSESPKRIQLRRTKGWRKPAGAIVVSRPTRWGNPWRPAEAMREMPWGYEFGWFATGKSVPVTGPIHWGSGGKVLALADCVDFHDLHSGPMGNYELDEEALALLRGHDLACWCPLDRPCHADALLKYANPTAALADVALRKDRQ